MKTNAKSALLGILVMLGAPVADAAATTSVAKMITMIQRDAEISTKTLLLDRDWIGEIKDEEDGVERIRLEKGRINEGKIMLLRAYPNGNRRASDAPVYTTSIPNDDELRSCTTVDCLEKFLGAGEPGFSAEGGPQMTHSSHSWVCFSPTAEDRLTYVRVFAHTSFDEEQRAKGTVQVNKLVIWRGQLRPADPGNPREKELYLSGADMFAAKEAEKARARQRFPQPLHDLIVADEHPDDSDLKHLSAAIQAIRDAPEPKLFAQLVQEMHEGTRRLSSLLNHILINEHNQLDLKPWGDKEEAIAVGACIDSLPLANEGSRVNLIETILRVCGGGKIEIEGKNGGRSIEVTPAENGYVLTLGGASHPLPVGEAQMELRRRYTNSRAEQ